LGLLFKLILYTLLFAFVVYVFKMIARLSHRVRATITDVNKLREVMQSVAGGVGGRPQAVSAEMVKCETCGAFVAAKEALAVSQKQRKQFFCSRECMR
jgi:hypothetical protein